MKDFDHKQFKDWLNQETEKEQTEDKLLVEAKLSKYWKARAARRAKMAKRAWPNKTDRDWAISEQEKSSKMNSMTTINLDLLRVIVSFLGHERDHIQ